MISFPYLKIEPSYSVNIHVYLHEEENKNKQRSISIKPKISFIKNHILARNVFDKSYLWLKICFIKVMSEFRELKIYLNLDNLEIFPSIATFMLEIIC